MDNATLAHNLRRLRDEKGLSQAQVAERTGISRVAYRNIETGTAAPRAGTLTGLAAALGVRIPDLMVEVHPLQAVRFRQKKMTSTRASLGAGVALAGGVPRVGKPAGPEKRLPLAGPRSPAVPRARNA